MPHLKKGQICENRTGMNKHDSKKNQKGTSGLKRWSFFTGESILCTHVTPNFSKRNSIVRSEHS